MKELVREWEEKIKRRLASEWAIGFNDRGHGHGDYAVIVKQEEVEDPLEGLTDDEIEEQYTDEEILEIYRKMNPEPELVVKCPDYDTAEHIVKIHNDSLKEEDNG